MPEATRVAAEIKRLIGVDPILIPGSKGIFSIVINGREVYSKYKTGQFPENGELPDILKN